MDNDCPYCKGTGKQVIEALPFPRYPHDPNMLIRAYKSMINLFYEWKAKGEKGDANGKVYNPEEHIDSIARATAGLLQAREITDSQNDAMITYLMSK